MNTDIIDKRIATLKQEQKQLEALHNALVEENQKVNREFQQQVLQNQTRYAQIQGAVTELQNLKQPIGDNNEHIDTSISAAIEGTSDRIPGDPDRLSHHSGADIRR